MGLDTKNRSKRIKLSQGKVALIDAEDFKKVSAFSWYASKSSTHFYAKRFQGKTPIYLHRFLMSAKKGQLVDHINGNTLDNRKKNLRFVCGSQNNANQKRRADRKFAIRGIYHLSKKQYPARKKRWVARGKFKTQKWCQYFFTLQQAITWQKSQHMKVFGVYQRGHNEHKQRSL